MMKIGSPSTCEAVKYKTRPRVTLLQSGKGKAPSESHLPSLMPSIFYQNKNYPSFAPTNIVSNYPTSSKLTHAPVVPTYSPSGGRTVEPSNMTNRPSTSRPTRQPVMKSSAPSLKPTDYPTMKTTSPSKRHTYVPSAISSLPPTIQPSGKPYFETRVPSLDPSRETSQIPSRKESHVPSMTPVKMGVPQLSYAPSDDISCEITNNAIGTLTGNSSVFEYTYEITYIVAATNISKLMEEVETTVMNGLLPIVDNCDGIRMTSNSIIGISADPDDSVSVDPCMNQINSFKCSRVEGRLTFFFMDTSMFNQTEVLIRIKEMIDYGNVEGRDEDIIDLQFISKDIIGGSGPISESDADEMQESFVKIPLYAWLLIAVGGLAGMGILARNLQRNMEKYRDVDSVDS